MVIIQHRIERLNPLRIDITITYDPIEDLGRFLDHLPSRCSQHTLTKFSGIVIHMPQQLAPGHGFRVHDVRLDHSTHLLMRLLEHPPDGGLTAPRGTNQYHTHPLLGGLIELQDLG